ncbi:MAG: hypothetical protein KHZ77_08215 [Veillonella sp.]|uniref:methylmalonyl-CoA decarboxylase subunit epsilon n=1 Tax=Veillonella sp. TaxID=1926307 RepID=UPI0025F5B031|nr:hypothetical protein [Veillonella sp.]MBS4914117.1 hypothetical protein [Veillonella sp.]
MDTQNMLIAVAGLIVLFIVVKLLKRNKSSETATESTAASTAESQTSAATAEATDTAATVAAEPKTSIEEERMTPNAANANVPEEVIAVIAAAVAAMGYDSHQIASIRPAKLRNWTLEARLSGRRQG